MSMRRMLGAVCLLAVLSVGVSAWSQGLPWLPLAAGSQQQTSTNDARGVQKDDSQLTVVEANADEAPPMVDTASKKKKSSFWNNKIFHPSQWFSKSKK
ncbi:MAG TPA: hypothetical protein VMJ32_14555 [Pirellulales bacterium]|nr:hypothetical protein [Pirellulales bacterium]